MLVAKIGVDTAENEFSKVGGCIIQEYRLHLYKEQKWEISGVGKEQKKEQRTKMRILERRKRTIERTKNKEQVQKNFRAARGQFLLYEPFPFTKALWLSLPLQQNLIKKFPRCARPEFFGSFERTKNKEQVSEFRISRFCCCFTTSKIKFNSIICSIL